MEMEKNLENKIEVSVMSVSSFSEEALEDILQLEKKCFPEEWQYDDAVEYYGEMLEKAENINIFLKEADKTVGYVLARPCDEELAGELRKDDKGMTSEPDVFYIETIQVLPEKRGMGGAKKLLIAVVAEAEKRGVEKFSIHARTVNGFHDKIKKIFEGRIKTVRQIEKWKPAANEPYEYIEWHK